MAIAGVQTLSQQAAALAKLTLVSPISTPTYSPVDPNGNTLGPALIFDYEGENVVELQSEITKHFVEKNSSVSDHIALMPEKITVHGFKGEVAKLFPNFVPALQVVQTVLAAVNLFSPSFSPSASDVIDEAAQSYSALTDSSNGAVNAWNTVNGGGLGTLTGILGALQNQTKQQLMFSQFYGYWSRQLAGKPPVLFAVQTPWAVFSPCALSGVRAIQDEKTKSITDFFLTFEVIRFVNTQVLSNAVSGRANTQYPPTQNNGTASLTSGPSATDQLTASGLSQ